MQHRNPHSHSHIHKGSAEKDNNIAIDRCSGLTPTRVHPSHPSLMASTFVRRPTDIAIFMEG